MSVHLLNVSLHKCRFDNIIFAGKVVLSGNVTHSDVVFKGCSFAEGYFVQAASADNILFDGCYIGKYIVFPKGITSNITFKNCILPSTAPDADVLTYNCVSNI